MPSPPELPSLPDLPLAETQARILDALLGGDAAPAVTLIHERAPRLDIYRDNAAAVFDEALRATYPAMLRLVGVDYFSQVARQFQRCHPSRSGDLRHVGAGFADLLASVLPGSEFAYLPDVARFEWLVQECLLAAPAPAPALDLSALGAVPPAEYDDLRFVIDPALALFQSCFPVRAIWEANVSADTEPDLIDLNSGGDRLALLQRRGQLEFHALDAGEYAFLQALSASAGFADAIDAGGAQAAASPAAFDPAATLRRCVAAGIIVDFLRPASTRG